MRRKPVRHLLPLLSLIILLLAVLACDGGVDDSWHRDVNEPAQTIMAATTTAGAPTQTATPQAFGIPIMQAQGCPTARPELICIGVTVTPGATLTATATRTPASTATSTPRSATPTQIPTATPRVPGLTPTVVEVTPLGGNTCTGYPCKVQEYAEYEALVNINVRSSPTAAISGNFIRCCQLGGSKFPVYYLWLTGPSATNDIWGCLKPDCTEWVAIQLKGTPNAVPTGAPLG